MGLAGVSGNAGGVSFTVFREKMRKSLVGRYGKAACPLWGYREAKIVSISQAPSAAVIKYKKPFADESGLRLRKDWYRVPDNVFYDQRNFYFTAVGMYFPGKNKNGGDKKPSLKFADQWLMKELSYLSPRLYLILGVTAAHFFFKDQDFETLVFHRQVLNGVTAYVLPHPSPINIKWLKDHPEFEKGRLPIIRKHIHGILCLGD